MFHAKKAGSKDKIAVSDFSKILRTNITTYNFIVEECTSKRAKTSKLVQNVYSVIISTFERNCAAW